MAELAPRAIHRCAARPRLQGAPLCASAPAAPPAALVVAAGDGGRVGRQGHLAGPLDGHGDLALVTPAGAGDAARLDLAAVAHEAAQGGDVLVVDLVDLLLAEGAVAASRGVDGTALLGRPWLGITLWHSCPFCSRAKTPAFSDHCTSETISSVSLA